MTEGRTLLTAWICPCYQPVLSYDGEASCSRKQEKPMMGFELTPGRQPTINNQERFSFFSRLVLGVNRDRPFTWWCTKYYKTIMLAMKIRLIYFYLCCFWWIYPYISNEKYSKYIHWIFLCLLFKLLCSWRLIKFSITMKQVQCSEHF